MFVFLTKPKYEYQSESVLIQIEITSLKTDIPFIYIKSIPINITAYLSQPCIYTCKTFIFYQNGIKISSKMLKCNLIWLFLYK